MAAVSYHILENGLSRRTVPVGADELSDDDLHQVAELIRKLASANGKRIRAAAEKGATS